MLDLLKKYIGAYSVSGEEENLRELIKSDLNGYANDITTDAMGNLFIHITGESSEKFMTAAHMDEIGFVVTAVEDSGLIRITNIGGVRLTASIGQEVSFKNGLKGVVYTDSGVKPENLSMKKLFVDIGAQTKKEAENKVKTGDTCHISPYYRKLSSRRIAAKAMDDRAGCAVVCDAIRRAKKFFYDSYFVFTVQEEVGLRGSMPAGFSVMPDYSLAVDVTVASDIPGETASAVKLGGGAAIKIKDAGVICSRKIIDSLTGHAENNKIPYQYEILLSGRTDTANTQTAGDGSAAGCISIPMRYIHSPVETVDIRDLRACSDLLLSVIEKGF